MTRVSTEVEIVVAGVVLAAGLWVWFSEFGSNWRP